MSEQPLSEQVGRFIYATLLEPWLPGTDKIFLISSPRRSNALGIIKRSEGGRSKCYAFQPAAKTEFNAESLRDIAAF